MWLWYTSHMIPLSALAALAPMLMQGKQGQQDQQNQPSALERANLASMGVGPQQMGMPQQGPQQPLGGPFGMGPQGTYQSPPMMAGTGYQSPGMNHQGAMTMSAAPWGGGMNHTGAQFTSYGTGGGMSSLF